MNILTLAEAAASLVPPEIAPLLNIGAIGCVLVWFMLRLEPRLSKLTEAMDRQTRMTGFTLIALETLQPSVKRRVEEILSEVKDAEAQRQKK